MFTVVFILLVSVVLVAVLLYARELQSSLGAFILFTFASRLALHSLVRNGTFFAHGVAGGDSMTYEALAVWIAGQWQNSGIAFKTAEDLEQMGQASLPSNLFAAVIYMNGGEATSFACTALVAFALCLAALDFYKLAIELGADKHATLSMTALLFSSPAMIFHSADTYKDPLVLLFSFGAMSSSLRLTRKFSWGDAAFGVTCLFALWFVRWYLVFLCVAPLAVGFLGLGSKNWTRPAVLLVVMTVGFALLLQNRAVTGSVDKAMDMGIGENHKGNLYGGSAVAVGDGIGSLPERLLYTLFAPFPWMGGSFGLQIGKVDTLLFYVIMYRAVKVLRGGKVARSVVIAFAAFVVPMAIAYAMSFANVGLILRQRIPIVVVLALFTLLGTEPGRKAAKASAGDRARAPRRTRLTGALPARSGPASDNPRVAR